MLVAVHQTCFARQSNNFFPCNLPNIGDWSLSVIFQIAWSSANHWRSLSEIKPCIKPCIAIYQSPLLTYYDTSKSGAGGLLMVCTCGGYTVINKLKLETHSKLWAYYWLSQVKAGMIMSASAQVISSKIPFTISPSQVDWCTALPRQTPRALLYSWATRAAGMSAVENNVSN